MNFYLAMINDFAAPLALPWAPPPCSEVSLLEGALGSSLHVTGAGTDTSSPQSWCHSLTG